MNKIQIQRVSATDEIDRIIDVDVTLTKDECVTAVSGYTYNRQLKENIEGIRDLLRSGSGSSCVFYLGPPSKDGSGEYIEIVFKIYHTALALVYCEVKQRADDFGVDIVADRSVMHMRARPYHLEAFLEELELFARDAVESVAMNLI